MRLEDQDWVINPNTGNKIDMRQLIRDESIVMQQVAQKYPFFERLIRELSPIYTFQVETQATDGTRLFINPEFTSGLSMKMKAFVLMHETMHCALDHMARGRYHDHRKSNIAADYEVNCALVDSGIVTPSDISKYIYDKKYSGWAYETIYADNPSGPPEPSPQQGGQEGSGGSQGGLSSDSDIDKMSGQQAANDAQQSADKAQNAADNAKGSGDKKKANAAQDAADKAKKAAKEAQDAANAGDDKKARQKAKEARDAAKEAQNQQGNKSQASNGARQEAAAASTPMGGFISQKAGAEIAKSEGYSGDDIKEESDSQLSQKWKDASISACSQNNSPGLGFFVTKINDIYLTKHDWRSELKKYIGRALNKRDMDSKYGKRKWLANDEIKKMDRNAENAFDDIVFLIDCSGSISDDLLKRIVSECYTIVHKKDIQKVTYAYYDDGIREIETTEHLRDAGKLNLEAMSRLKKAASRPKAEIHGRGGNNERNTMDQLLKLIRNKKLELVMWFTDGYTNSVPVRPRNIKNMIWVVYDNPDFKATDDSRVIRISSKDLG